MRSSSRRDDESGMALITVFLVLMLVSALMVGFFATIVADQKENGIDRDQTQAYAAAHAGLEKLTSNLAALFVTDYSPSRAQIGLITAKPPTIPGFTFTAPGGVLGSGYAVGCPVAPCVVDPVPDRATGSSITSGPYAGFKGIVTRYPITVTARSTGGAEVRLRRELQTVAVPVYQFGVFSETDLTFYAGDNFNFGGRVQTNGSLFLSQLSGFALTLSDRVTAYKEVVRNNLSNGLTVASTFFTGTVNVLDTTAGHVRALATNEGSVTGMPSTAIPPTHTLNTNWTGISTGTYKSLLRNGLTGAKYLALPIVSQGALPIDLIRRPTPPISPATALEDVAKPLIFGQRYFAMASMRILLSDTAAEITSLPTIVTPLTTPPEPLDWGVGGTPWSAWYTVDAAHPPIATSPGVSTAAANFMATTGWTSTTVALSAAPPAYFKLPTIKVGLNYVNCTGRTPTTFTGCVPTLIWLAVPAGAGTPVLATVSSGAGALNLAVSTSSSQVAISALGLGARTIAVPSTAAFAPTVFWMKSTSGRDGGSFTCTGYDGTSPYQLTGCSGLPAVSAATTIHTGALEVAGTALNRGFIKIEMLNSATPPVWTDVTREILKLGFSGPANMAASAALTACDPTPDAVIRLQHVRDNPGGVCIANSNSSLNSNDYWPNVLYDTREGILRDDAASTTDFTMGLGGVMNYVTLDVGNLKKWLAGTTGTTGVNTNNQSGSGYIVYFSDRRGNKCPPGPSCYANMSIPGNTATTLVETGEYGYEDNVNPNDSAGTTSSPIVFDVGEDVNKLWPVPPATVAIDPSTTVAYVPVQDIYGTTPRNAIGAAADPLGSGAKVIDPPGSDKSDQWVGMVNRPIFFRRALKLVNGGNIDGTHSRLPSPGLSVAAENPVYVQGNYNATAGPATPLTAGVTPSETHMAAAVLADAVTLLSNNWNDNLSFQFPNNAPSRSAVTTGFRFAVVAGKGLSFPYPTSGTPQFLFGTDGGVGNFLRLLEDWSPGSVTIRYRGSMVSMFINRQATGTFKYSTQVYDYGLRNFVFDDDFLMPGLLPPGTPMFRDVNTLTFRQLLRPNQ